MGCYFPQPLPAGIEDNPNAGFNVHYGSVDAPEDGTIELRGNSRAYLVKGNERQYHLLNLLGKTLHFTADVSNVPCSNNAALYFVSMRAGRSPGSYCDIQTQPSCTELDLFEANRGAIQTNRREKNVEHDGHATESHVENLMREHEPTVDVENVYPANEAVEGKQD